MKSNLDQLVEDWLATKPLCEASKVAYRRTFRVYNTWIIRHTHASNALGATREDVVAFKAWLEKKHKSDNTVANYMTVVRMFHRYAAKVGRMERNVASGIMVKAPIKIHRRKPLNDEQTHRLMESIDLRSRRGMRDRIMLLLMLQAGLRCVEVSRLDLGDFYYEGEAWRLRIQRKGHRSKDTIIRLRRDLGDEMHGFFGKTRTPSAPMFAALTTRNRQEIVRLTPGEIGRIVTDRLKDAGVKGAQIGPHSLRHTYGCNLVKKGVPLEEIQLLMGHSSTATTMIYAIDAKEQKIDENNPSELLDKL